MGAEEGGDDDDDDDEEEEEEEEEDNIILSDSTYFGQSLHQNHWTPQTQQCYFQYWRPYMEGYNIPLTWMEVHFQGVKEAIYIEAQLEQSQLKPMAAQTFWNQNLFITLHTRFHT